MSESIVIDQDGYARVGKDPDAVLDYSWDWSAWLGSDTIASYTVTVDGVTLDSDSQNASVITAWLSGGTVGQTATATCRITTASSPARTDDRTIYLDVDER